MLTAELWQVSCWLESNLALKQLVAPLIYYTTRGNPLLQENHLEGCPQMGVGHKWWHRKPEIGAAAALRNVVS